MEHSFVGLTWRLSNFIFASLFCVICIQTVNVHGDLQGRVEASRSSEDGMEVWGYSEVRKGAHMFWWLFYSTHPEGSDTRPLIIWLQGGPGLSSTGIGNLALMGPLDETLQPRNTTWVNEANILFVDNPIDVGFSYMENGTLPAKNCDEIAWDLINMLDSVMHLLPQLKNMTVYIFGQSYGGKMAVAFAYHLYKAIENKETVANLKGVALGNAWISPVDTTVNWAPLLLHMSVIDQHHFAALDRLAHDFVQEWETCGIYCNTTIDKWFDALERVHHMSNWVNVYNLEKYNTKAYFENDLIPKQMQGVIHQKLQIIPAGVSWNFRSNQVYGTALKNDFFQSEVYKVDWLLKRNIEVIIYQGQLDIICPTNGAQDWLNKLKWKKFPLFYQSRREPLFTPESRQPEMFVKAYENLKFYWVLRAGHAVPKDTPAAALRMILHIIENQHVVGAEGALQSQSHHHHASSIVMVVQILTVMVHYRIMCVFQWEGLLLL